MQEPHPLTTDEIRFFRHNGFLKLPWRLPAELVEAVKKQATDDIEQEVMPLSRDYRGDVMRLSAVWQRGGGSGACSAVRKWCRRCSRCSARTWS